MSINNNFIIEPEKRVPVYKTVNVVVAGGGPAGFGAAVAAARLHSMCWYSFSMSCSTP